MFRAYTAKTMHSAATVCLLAAAPLLAAAQDYEWAGIFNAPDTSHTWTMQKASVGGTYADAAMWLVIIPTDTVTAANMETLEAGVADLVTAGCAETAAGGTMTAPAMGGSCFNLQVDAANDDSTWTIDTSGLTGMAIYTQHVPTEFERDAHYLTDSSGDDIEPVAVPAAFEWSGVFSLDGMTSPCKWSMQANALGEYPDQSMIVVIMPTAAADVATEAAGNAVRVTMESAAKGLLGLIGSSCAAIANGGTMTPAAAGSCYILNVGDGSDSEFDIITTGLDGVTVFAQHVPVEFERDVHYFYDSAAPPNMIDPVAESADDVAHAHGSDAATVCAANEYVSSNACTACATGSTRSAGDDASGGDTVCAATLCAANEYVSSNACTTCATGSTRPAGDDASGGDTACAVTSTPAPPPPASGAAATTAMATLVAVAMAL
jgi:hypothetical protein